MNRLFRLITFCLFGLLMLCIGSYRAFGQFFIPPGGISTGTFNMDSSGAYLSDMVAFMRSHITQNDTSEGGPQTLVDAFEKYWGKRVVQNGTSAPNMFEKHLLNLSAAAQARKAYPNCPPAGVWGGNWINDGPDSLADQNIGFITCVWVDPANVSRLLVGTHGGLFRSTDGGLNWSCITDNAPINNGLIDVTGICVHPTNKDIIYLSTNSEPFIPNPREWGWLGKDYGAGVIYTTNGTATTPTWGQEFPRALGGTPQWYDSILSIGNMYFSPNASSTVAGRLYAVSGNKIYYRTYNTPVQWKTDASAPKITIAFDDMRFLDDTTFFIPGNNKTIYKFKYHAATQSHTWESISFPALTYPSFQVYDTLNHVYTMLPYTIDSFEMCRLRLLLSQNSLYVIVRSHTSILPDTFTHQNKAVGKPIRFVNGNDYLPKDALLRYHLNNNTWSTNTLAIPQLWTPGSGSCFTFCVSTYDTNNVYYGNAVAQFSNDGGRNNWYQIADYYGNPTHGDIRNMTPYSFQASSTAGAGDRVYFATDGGVMTKPLNVDPIANGYLACKNLDGKGLAAGDYVGVGTSEGGPFMMGGAIHSGFQAYEADKTPKWLHINDGDNENVVFSRTNTTKAFGNEWQGTGDLEETIGVTRRMDYTSFIDTFAEHAAFNYPLMWADQFGNIYVGLQHMWRYDPGGVGYRRVSGNGLGSGTNISLPKEVDGSGVELPMAAMAFSTYYTGPVGYTIKLNGHMYYRGIGQSSFSTPITTPAYTYGLPPTGLAMDMAKPDRVWLSLGGENPSSTPQKRVYYSSNHGSTWTDISQGLPAHLPVTALVYQEGTPYLYAATDVGIYRYDTSAVGSAKQWTCFNNGKVAGKDFPCVNVSKLEINYCQGKLYASTYGRSIWSTDLLLDNPAYYSPALGDHVPEPSLQIKTNTVWNSEMRIYSGIHVMSGNTLTINNSGGTQTVIHMPKNGAIQVDTNATLIIDGAKITNDCDGFWKGILVAGKPNRPHTFYSAHGHVFIKNGAIIEHARLGVANCLESLVPNWNTTAGGIIKIDNSFFYNNARGVGFAPYHNKYSGLDHDDSSYIKGSTFEVNNNYRGVPLNYWFQAHINMSNVDGIKIQGDTFRNICTTMPYSGYGITSWSSSYYVIPYCVSPGCAPSAYKHNYFQGFNLGINSNDAGLNPLNYCFIDYANFKGNSIGIYAKYNNWCEIFRSDFKMDTSGYPYSNTCYCVKGIYLLNSPQFRIEDNTFSAYRTNRSGSGILSTYGAQIDNSGDISSEIYHNTFTGIDICLRAWGNNGTHWSKLNPDPPGLQTLCNAFNRQGTGLLVDGTGATGGLGIRVQQGSVKRPVENAYTPLFPTTWSGTCGTNWSDYAVANGGWYITSNWHNPIPSSSSCSGYLATFLPNTTFTNTCASRKIITPPDYSGTTYKLADAQSDFAISKTLWQDATSILHGKMDGGNTSQLLTFIASSSDATLMHDTLLHIAPYLSYDVLNAAAAPGKVPEALMMDVLIACPDMLNTGLVDDLSASYSPTDIDILNSHRSDISLMSYDKADVNDNFADMVRSHADVIGFLKMDSAGLDVDTLAYWYKQLPALWPRYATALMYLGEGNYHASDDAMDAIASDFELSGDSLDTYNSYKDIITVLKSAFTDGRSELGLDSSELATLLTIAQRGHRDASFLAQNLYDQNLGINEIPCQPESAHDTSSGGDGGEGLRMAPNSVNGSPSSQGFVSVYPNPAHDKVTFSYKLPTSIGSLTLTITTITGQLVHTTQFAEKFGKYEWDASHLPSGTYTYKLADERGTIKIGKLTLVR